MRRISHAAMFATGLACFCEAAMADDPSSPLKIIEPKRQAPVLEAKLPELAPAPAPIPELTGGDMAAVWVSPLLQNHDSRVSGVIYKVEGKPQYTKFSFSVVNPSQEALDVTIRCQDKAGNALPKYDAVLKLAANGAANWSAETIAPERSTDLLTKDADHVWCALSAERPFAAFGSMFSSDSASGQNGVTAINLVAASR